jgi:hypothetical protein
LKIRDRWPRAVQEMVAKLWNREAEYAIACSHHGCHRTSNLVDRLMNRLTRFLDATAPRIDSVVSALAP